MGNIFVQNFSKNRLTKVQRVWYNRKPGETSVAGPPLYHTKGILSSLISKKIMAKNHYFLSQ